MVKKFKRTLLIIFCFVTYITAGVPIRSYGYQTMGIEYSYLSRGQIIKDGYSDSYETLHMLNFCYSPFEFLRITFGIGIDKYNIVEQGQTKFNGNYGFSPGFKVTLFTPRIANKIIRFTSQLECITINSDDNYDNYYKGILVNPCGGLILHLGPYVDIETGVKVHYVKGWGKYTENAKVKRFSNDHKVRSYVNLSLCSLTGSYLSLNIDMSPEVSSESNKRLNEATVGFSIGIHFRAKNEKKDSNDLIDIKVLQ